MPRKVMSGRVVSDKMAKTVVVQVGSSRRHPTYRKVIRTSKNYLAHDEDQACKEGDFVRIEETRPLSRRKRWRVVEVLRTSGSSS